MNAWSVLGIPATRDAREIRRAYATRLKAINQRTEQEAFQNLRAAYEYALRVAEQAAAADNPKPEQRPRDEELSIEHTQVQTVTTRTPPRTQRNTDTANRRRPASANPAPATMAEAGEQASDPAADVRDPREHDWARVEELVQFFADTLNSQGEDAAIEAFRKTLASEELHSLQLRDMLEWRLILSLVDAKRLPIDFVSVVVDFFGWTDRPDLAASSAGPALRELLRRRELQLQYNELLALATTNYYTAHLRGTALTRQAAQSLLSPYSPLRFRWRAMSSTLLAQVRVLLADIQARAPDLPETFLDPKTVSFWRNAVANPPPSSGLLAFGTLMGFFISLMVAADMTGPGALGAMALIILATVVAFVGVAVARRYWLRTWQPKLNVWLAVRLERSIGRVLPGAVQAGFGWKQVLLTLVMSPFLALAAIGFLPPHIEQPLGRLYVPVLMLVSATVLFLSLAIAYQIKHLLARRASRGGINPERWKPAVITVLIAGAVLAAAAGQPALLGLLMLIVLVRYVAR
jgi:hypothetical protein